MAWAELRAATEDQAAWLVLYYSCLGSSVLHLRQHPREQISWLEAQRDAAHRLKQRDAEGVALGNLGLAYADLGEPRRAIDFHEQDLVIRREIGDRRGEGNTLWNKALSLEMLGERAEAIVSATAALKILQEIESPHAGMVREQLGAWRGEGEPETEEA